MDNSLSFTKQNDSNILFMAEDVWQQENNLIYKLCKNPREVLLENLGRASEIYPPLLNALTKNNLIYGSLPQKMPMTFKKWCRFT